ncbi:GATOR2 complex protein WDR59-like isoform X2 [Liolophura sinensis]|uniref:GATOR2 complex protein WDR59-like isoform X2 n=1 Tax=Liolophura sinensis TaxID=3198878 RepID=UPI0031592887
MAARWSSEHVVVELKDLQADVMAVDCQGEWALLAGRRVLALANLKASSPADSVKKIPRQSKWLVSCVQWNPHRENANLFATATNQRVDVCSFADRQGTQFCSLKAHTRNISGLDWSPFDTNLIATCSVDTFTYLWDIRDPKKPSSAFQTVAGAAQVKWNKKTRNLFATTHEGDIRIWDPRKGNAPLQYIAAHLSKIHGLDWNPNTENNLSTSSQDCTVKFWDVTSPRRPEGVLSSGSPVWRARYTPFGQGLVTVVVPQLRRGENSLLLWNTNNLTQPVHTFVGHTDVVLEFHWRKQPAGAREHQLVTWSRDQSLRIWRIEPQLQKLCGHTVVDDVGDGDSQPVSEAIEMRAPPSTLDLRDRREEELTPPLSPLHLKTEGETATSPQQPRTLQQEFSLVNIDIPNVSVEMNAASRTCKVVAMRGINIVYLLMTFPVNYPNTAAPAFQFLPTTSIDKSTQAKLGKALEEVSHQHVKRNRSCLEPCLRQLIASLDNLTSEDRKTPDSDTPFGLPTSLPVKQHQLPSYMSVYSYGNYQDSLVPFPRTSGARFCSNGALVCFNRPTDMKRVSGSNSDITPRALVTLSAYTQPPINVRTPQTTVPYTMKLGYSMARSPPTNNDLVSISNFYTYRDKKPRPRSRSKLREKDAETRKSQSGVTVKKPSKVGIVRVYDISRLLTVHKQLAEEYKLSDDVESMCSHNASVAAAFGRKDLVQVWNLVNLSCSKTLSPDLTNPDKGPPWARNPFGKQMIKSLMEHYCRVHDVQTLAMLSCVFWTREDSQKASTQSAKLSQDTLPPSYSPYHTVSSTSNLLKGWVSATTPPHSTVVPSEVASNPYIGNIQLPAKPQPTSPATMKLRRSNSWSDSYEDYRFVEDFKDPEQVEREQHENSCRLLDLAQYQQYDSYKRAYADILYRWGLRNQSAEILKHISVPPEGHRGIEFGVICHYCGQEIRGAQCGSCKNAAFQCGVCHTGVRGASNFCLSCGHGGHTLHMLEWFQSHELCPSGCGCHCLESNPMADS